MDDLEKKISPEIGAVVIVHIGGIISDKINIIQQICERNKVPLIEDAAHAHLSSSGTNNAGSVGEIACFSFFSNKSNDNW